MPRAASLDAPGLLQHVIVRGVERCDIFRDDGDRNRFVENLSKLLGQTGIKCLAWALMSIFFGRITPSSPRSYASCSQEDFHSKLALKSAERVSKIKLTFYLHDNIHHVNVHKHCYKR